MSNFEGDYYVHLYSVLKNVSTIGYDCLYKTGYVGI